MTRIRVLRKPPRRSLLSLGVAVCCLSALAQAGHAATVGFLNVPIPPGGYALIENPLHVAPSNRISAVLTTNSATTNSGVITGAQVWLWDTTNQVFSSPSLFTNGAWTVDFELPPGRGFMIRVPVSTNLTFVGEVLTGQLTNSIAGSNKLCLVGSKVPQSETLQAMGIPGTDGELVYLWDSETQQHKDASTYFAGYGWHGGGGTNGPSVKVAEAFFVQKHGPDTNWVRSYQIQLRPPADVQAATVSSAVQPDLRRLEVQGGSVSLEIANPAGSPYDVRFSPDCVTWTTIATRQTGGFWSGPYPGGTQGYYQVVGSNQ